MGIVQNCKRLWAGCLLQLPIIMLLICFFRVSAMVMESHGNMNASIASNDVSDSEDSDMEKDCIDWERKNIPHGEKYIPYGADLCMECTCDNSFPIVCQSVACSAPENCPNAKLLSDKCCEYECFPGDSSDNGNSTGIGKDPTKDTEESITNLSLRLIASTVTSLLFLALLLFMVYRLRQRRLLLAMRRYEARSRIFNSEDTDSEHYIPDNLMSLECPPYTDPPPPYSPPKPPHIYFGEQPPAYDEISLAGNPDNQVERSSSQQERSTSGNELAAITVTRSPVQPERMELSRSAPESRRPNSSRHSVETLPAYASTDVVQGLDNMLARRNCTFHQNCNDWRSNGSGSQRSHPDSFYNRNTTCLTASSSHPHSFSSCQADSERHDLPPVTAFQRFSSLFKRNAPKSKNRHGQARPVTECLPPPQYATVPRNDYGSSVPPSGYASFMNSGSRRSQGSSRSVTRSLTDRMCFSYDSARAAYELAAMSPSTSSNSSSSGGLASSCNVRDRDVSRQNPLHSQQFQDDLRRHLPPLQTSDSSEFVAPNSPPTCPSTLSVSSSSTHQTTAPAPNFSECHGPQQQPRLATIPHLGQAQEGTTSIVYDLTGSLSALASCPPTPSHVQAQPSDHLEERQGGCASHPPQSVDPLKLSSSSSSSPHHSCTQPSGTSPNRSPAENPRNADNKTPSPPLPGCVMRRSHSGVSAVSMFSVCSETGEKKLKDGETPTDTKVLASDSQYPYHHSLSRSKMGSSSSYRKAEVSFPLAARNIEEDDFQSSKTNGSNSSHPADEIFSAGQGSARLPIHPQQYDVCEEAEVNDSTAVVPQDSQIQEGSRVAGFLENDLNQGGLRNKPSCLISTPLNIRPTSPFVTAQSGQLIPVSSESPKHRTPAEREAKSVHLESRKVKKKKGSSKEKSHSQPSPQHRQNQKISNKHLAVSCSNGNSGSSFSKSDVPCRDVPSRTNSKPRPSRGGEKKKRTLSSLAPPLENSESPNVDWLFHSRDDTNLRGYGNADVYRSFGCDAVPTSPFHPGENPSLQGYADNKSVLIGNTHSKENGDLPGGGYTFSTSAERSLSQPRSGHGDRSCQPPATRKKGGHKRQASAGDRITNGCSPSQRPRPKSMAGADRIHGRRFVEPDSSAAEHNFPTGRGAKSGFGQDMNLDDEMGMIDFFNQGADYYSTKTTAGRASVGNDPNLPLPASARSHTRSITDSVFSQPQHGNSRSGLSNDLSFVNGSCPAAEKGKKRASLPSIPVFSSHSQVGANVGGRSIPGRTEERVGREDGRHRNSLPDDSHPQATSYV